MRNVFVDRVIKRTKCGSAEILGMDNREVGEGAPEGKKAMTASERNKRYREKRKRQWEGSKKKEAAQTGGERQRRWRRKKKEGKNEAKTAAERMREFRRKKKIKEAGKEAPSFEGKKAKRRRKVSKGIGRFTEEFGKGGGQWRI